MAEKRMFTKKITDDDAFISMPSSAQALYFHLNQSADDDGFTRQTTMAMYKAHASEDDLRVLLAKNYIIRFDSGVMVIKHWKLHNSLRKDRYTPTSHQEELKMLRTKKDGTYTLNEGYTEWLPDGCQMVAKRLPDGCQVVAVDKYSIEKDSIEECSKEKDNIEADLSVVLNTYATYINSNLSPMVAQAFIDYHDQGISVDTMEKAIHIASDEGKKSLSYIKGILNNALQNGGEIGDKKPQKLNPKAHDFPERDYSQDEYKRFIKNNDGEDDGEGALAELMERSK